MAARPLFSCPRPRLLFAVAALLAMAAPGRAAEPRVTLSSSLAPVPVAVGARAGTRHRLISSVTALSAKQLAAPLEFSVALEMRDLAGFQARVGSGELVPYEEVQAKYMPLQADYDRVAAWLKSEGFTLTFDDTSRLSVFARGTVTQIQKSFGVTMQSVTVNGVAYPSATTAPSLPASMMSGVLGVNGLQPHLRKEPNHVTIPPGVKLNGLSTDSSSAPNQPPFLINEIRNAYNGGTLTTTVNGTTTTLTGSGQKIAIVIDAFALHSDLTTFWTNNNVPQTLSDIEEVNVPGGTPDTTSGEETLDESWSSGIAPGAVVRVYCSDNLEDSYTNECLAQIQKDVTGATAAAIAQPNLHAMSMSYGEDQTGVSGTAYKTEAAYYVTIANGNTFYGGVSIFASSGDGGSQQDEPNSASYVVNYPAADASITGVGGTDLYYSSTAVNGRNWTEKGWGELTAYTTNSGATAYEYGGSGGGAATSTIPRPAWQVGTGVASGTTRLVPDVSSVGGPTYAYLIFDGNVVGEYGTSWSSPSWAGYAALINQARSLQGRLPLGALNRRVYPLIGTANFYDVTSGNNSYINPNTKAGGTANFNCTAGYDEVTGVGTPNLTALVGTLIGPTITGFTPSNGVAGTSVVITGTNFYTSTANPLTVTFNGTAASSVTVNSATQITAVTPGSVTTGPIVVTSIGDATATTSNFVVGAPDLMVTSTHSGNFTTDDTGDTYTITVTNGGNAATSGTVSVVDTLPNGALTATSLTGTGWTIASNNLSATRTDALAAGGSYPALTLTVSVPGSAQTTTNQVNVSGGGETNTSNDVAQDSTTIVGQTPSQAWRYQYFGTNANTGNAADTANPAGDGLVNLTKYALGLDPTMPEVNPETEDTSTGYLRLTVPKNANATDITYSVQVTSDLTNPASWTTSGTTVDQNTSTTLQVQDNTPVSGTAERFIRLQVSR